MKKTICAVLTAVITLSLFGCADDGAKEPWKKDNNPKQVRMSIDELKENDGVLLQVYCGGTYQESEEDFDEEPDKWTVYYSGYTYKNDGEGAQMDDEDLLFIYNFCIETYENDPFADYDEAVADGEGYGFYYFDTDGNPYQLYSGYCYENETLQNVIGILKRYENK